MSPEYYAAYRAGTRVPDPDGCAAFRNDMYGLGATAYAVLTGAPPAHGVDSDRLLFPLSTPSLLSSLIRSMLRDNPMLRATASTVAGSTRVIKHMCNHLNGSVRRPTTRAIPTVSRILRGALGIGALNQSWRSHHLKCADSMREQLARLGVPSLRRVREIADEWTPEQAKRVAARMAAAKLANAPRQDMAVARHVARMGGGKIPLAGVAVAAAVGAVPAAAVAGALLLALAPGASIAADDVIAFTAATSTDRDSVVNVASAAVAGPVTRRRVAMLACAEVTEDAFVRGWVPLPGAAGVGAGALAPLAAVVLPFALSVSATAAPAVVDDTCSVDYAAAAPAELVTSFPEAVAPVDGPMTRRRGVLQASAIPPEEDDVGYEDALVDIFEQIMQCSGDAAAESNPSEAGYEHAAGADLFVSPRLGIHSWMRPPAEGGGAAVASDSPWELRELQLGLHGISMSPRAPLPVVYPATPLAVDGTPARVSLPSSRKRRNRSSPPSSKVAEAAAASSANQKRAAVIALVRAMFCNVEVFEYAMGAVESQADALDSAALAAQYAVPASAQLPLRVAPLPHIRHGDVDGAFVARIAALEASLEEIFKVRLERNRVEPFSQRNALSLVKRVLKEWNDTLVSLTSHKVTTGVGLLSFQTYRYSIDFRANC